MTTLHILSNIVMLVIAAILIVVFWKSTDRGLMGNRPARSVRKAAKRNRRRSTRECEIALRQELRAAASRKLHAMRANEPRA